MIDQILVGPFLTRADAAARAHHAKVNVALRPDLLRMRGRFLEETYFAFQFDDHGIKEDVGSVVLTLRGVFDDVVIADWLARPNVQLGGDSPLGWLGRHGRRSKVLDAARRDAQERSAGSSSNTRARGAAARPTAASGKSRPGRGRPHQARVTPAGSL